MNTISTMIAAPEPAEAVAVPAVGRERAPLPPVAPAGDAEDDGRPEDAAEHLGRPRRRRPGAAVIFLASSIPSVTAGLMWQPLIGPMT